MSSLLNKQQMRRFILETWAEMRPGHAIERVSAQALEDIEARLRHEVRGMIRTHPSVGKTFKP